MKQAKLAFDQIKANSITLARRLRAAGIFTVDEQGRASLNGELEFLEVSFIGFESNDRLLIEDVAVVALLIRWVALAGREVQVVYPKKFKGEPSRVFYYLERLQFHKLLANGVPGENWHLRVTFKNYDPALIQLDTSSETMHYLPLQWFSVHDFGFDSSLTIWKREPRVEESFAQNFRSLLLQQGFSDKGLADTLLRVLFLELGWNSVLHAEQPPGTGVGIFGLQVISATPDETENSRLRFVVADWGQGIPFTLGPFYERDTRPSYKLRPRRGVSRATDVVRYSLFPDTSSRPEHPSKAFELSYRGLARVASALYQSGRIHLRSGGGAVKLVGQVKGETVAEADDSFAACALPGTQVVGELMRSSTFHVTATRQKDGIDLPDLQVIQVCDILGHCGQIATEELAQAFVGRQEFTKEIVLFDLGFAESGSRMIEYLCRAMVKASGPKWLIFWNVADEWPLMGALESYLLIVDEFTGMVPPLCVRGFGDARLLGAVGDKAKWRQGPARARHYAVVAKFLAASKAAQTTLGPPVGVPVQLSRADFHKLHLRVNSQYLRQGFEQVALEVAGETANGAAGFFVGQIYLIKGGPAEPRYFALRRNLDEGGDRLRKRWTHSLAAALNLLLAALPPGLNEEVVLIGFTGTIRDILEEACALLPTRTRAYVLLTFDVPTKEELAGVVKENDAVILVTDIISSGTLAESVADVVLRIGGKIAGVTSLVLRPVNDRVSGKQIRLGREQYYYLPAGNLPPWNSGQAMLTQTKFWVDPVSLVPSTRPAWGWSPETIKRIDQTLTVISDADAAACGHIVDGSRHASTFVFTHLLFKQQEPAIRRLVQQTVDHRLTVRGWNNFDPRVLLHPSGVARLERIGAATGGGGTPPKVANYQSSIATCILMIRGIWTKIDAHEVARAFDPSGAARCAQTVHISQSKQECGDIVVLDDGIWKGTTTNALIQLAMSLCARRIFVLPMLARLTPQDAETFETLHSLQGPANPETGEQPMATEVCYAFPLHLPVPFYSFHECPYEITQARLRDRQGANLALRSIGDKLIEEIEGRAPSEARVHSREYKDAWLRARAYTELASQNKAALQKLQNLIDTIPPGDGLTAIFTLFVDEWRLLGRARVRHDIFQCLRKRALVAAVDPQVETPLRTMAITILRALFRDDFVEILPRLVSVVVGEQAPLERLIFHIATLPNEWRKRPSCLRTLEELIEKCVSTAAARLVTQEMVAAEHSLLSFVRSLVLDLKFSPRAGESPKQATIEFRHQLEGGFLESHNLIAYFKMCSHLKAEKLTSQLVRDLELEWDEDHGRQLKEKLLPMLMATSAILIKTASIQTVFLPSEYSFLSNDCQEFTASIGSFEHSLYSLRSLTSQGAVRQENAEMAAFHSGVLVNAGRQIFAEVMAPDSLVRKLLADISSVRAVQLAEQFAKGLETALSELQVKVEITGIAQLTPSQCLFVSHAMVRQCIANVAHNLVTHAFPQSPVSTRPRVRVSMREEVVLGGDPMLILTVANNGQPLTVQAELGEGGRHVAANLAVYGGHFAAAQSAESNEWSVQHTIQFQFWNRQ